jgi:predicted PurR-regulated permease PerM
MQSEPNRESRRFFYVLLAVVLVLGVIFLRPYLMTLLFAVLLAFLFQPLYDWFEKVYKGRQWLAVPSTIIGIGLLFVIPLSLAAALVVRVVTDFVQAAMRGGNGAGGAFSISALVEQLNTLLAALPWIGYRVTEADVITRLQGLAATVQSSAWQGFQGIGTTLTSLVPIVFITLYVMSAVFSHYHKISRYIHALSPLDDQIDRMYAKRITSMIISMVRGTFVIAALQGIVTGLSLWIVGVPYAAFLGLLATVVSIIPLGSVVVAVPFAIYLAFTGNLFAAVFVAGVNLLITSNIDNVLRPRLVMKEANLHPSLVLIGLFAGISSFGFLGIIFGPVLMVILATTIEVYRLYFAPGSVEG